MSGVHLWESMMQGQTHLPVTALSNLTHTEQYSLVDGIKMHEEMIHGSLTWKKGYVHVAIIFLNDYVSCHHVL